MTASTGNDGKVGEAQADGGDDDKKKPQKRGGKGMIKPNKKKEDVEKRITVSRAPRGKKKSVTVVTGLSTFGKIKYSLDVENEFLSYCLFILGVDLKVAAKYFGTKFACGSSVTGDDEIVIQGDVKDDLFDFIPEKFPEIDEDLIEDLGDQKR